jgi:hypothetical protein
MAYTLFAGPVRPGWPGTSDGISWFFPAAADVMMLDEDGEGVPPHGEDAAWSVVFTLASAEGIEPGDGLADLRGKLARTVRAHYPRLAHDAAINVVWIGDDAEPQPIPENPAPPAEPTEPTEPEPDAPPVEPAEPTEPTGDDTGGAGA